MQSAFNFRSDLNPIDAARPDLDETLDLGSLWQAAGVLTATLDFNNFIARLHQTFLEFSGAQSCLLALPDRDDGWQFHSQSSAGVAEISIIDRPLADEIDRPANIIYLVGNTHRAIGGDARSEIELPDRYLLTHQPPSVWVVPLIKAGRVLGVVYLEHRQAANLFTHQRQLALSLLCESAAIALDNAHCYRDARQEIVGTIGIALDITDRKQTERELKLTQFAIDNSVDGITWVRPDGSFAYGNQAICQTLGYSPTQWLDLHVWDVDESPIYSPCNWPKFWQRVKTEKQLKIETTVRDRDGNYHPLELSINYFEFEGEEYSCVQARDITDRKQTERDLQLTRLAVENSADGIAWLSQDSAFVYANPAMCRMLDYTLAEVRNLHIWDIADAASPDVWSQHWQKLQAHKTLTFESEHHTRDGKYYPVEITCNYFEFEGERYNCFLTRDITDRLQAERELKFTQFAVDNTADGIAWIGSDGKFTYGNQTMCQLLGYLPAQLQELSVWDVDPSYSSQIWPTFWQHLQAEGQLSFETQVRDRDGNFYPVELSANYFEFQGEQRSFVSIRNITDRKQAEITLRDSEARYHQIVSNIPAALYQAELTASGDYRLNYTSARFAELFDLPETAEITDISAMFALVLPEDRESFARSMPQTALPWLWEGRIATPTGKIKWIRGESCPSTTADGRIVWDGILSDITDRQQATLALRKSEERYEQLVANVPVALYQFEVNAEGKQQMNYMSPRFYEMFEMEPDPSSEAILLSFDGVHPEDRQSFANAITTSVATDNGWVWEGRMFTATGKLKWIRGESTPFPNSDGGLIWDGMMVDITERKQTEIALRESEARYQKLADNLPGVIYQLRMAPDGSLSYPYRSSGCWDLFETAPAAAMADAAALMQYLHPDDAAAAYEAIVDSASNLSSKSLEGRFILPSGDIKWIKSVSRPERQADGAIVWDGMMLDVTDRQQAQLELAASRQKHYNLIQSVNGVVWEYDLNADRFIFVSDRAADLLGYPVEAWLAENFWQQRVHPEDLDRVIAIHDEALQQHRNCELEYRMLDARGREIWVYDVCSLVYDARTQAIASSGVPIDISDRKQVETELQHSNDRLAATNVALERATQLKDEFLATMSHELRTPLNAILGMSEALQEQVFGNLNTEQIKSIETIERGGKHLLSLINDILDVSKISAGKVELDINSVSLSNLCNSSLAFIRQQAFQKQIQLDLRLPADRSSISIDERRIRQVPIDLLGNAVKFTPNGGRIELAISAREYTGAWNWEFAVSDSGIGIAPADLDRLFQPFTQLDSKLNRQYEGTGLGLTLAKQIVELHGGTLSVESELDRGSCFRVRLPYAGDLPGENIETSASSGNLPGALSAPIAGLYILIVEDNLANYHTISSYLQAKGYRTAWAENGVAAIRLLQESLATGNLPDLALVDMQMPEMDGLETIDRIRNQLQLKALPVIALTALAMAGDRERALAAGANDYLTKPVKLKQLHATIQQRVESRG